jgi:urease beta subunit
MSESGEQDRARRARLRWINLGEAIAIGALVISGLGLWHEWRKDDAPSAPAMIVEEHQRVPIILRAIAVDDGSALDISPFESNHSLDSAIIAIEGASPIEIGSDGRLAASDVERALDARKDEAKGKTLSVTAQITARYIESGSDRRGGGTYRLRYRWEGGGLLGGRSIRLVGLSR